MVILMKNIYWLALKALTYLCQFKTNFTNKLVLNESAIESYFTYYVS